jgi:dTDP-4-amino-4,6-dideoxygalactose transaminase
MTRKLSILGGKPAFTAPLHVGRPNVGNAAAFLMRVEQMLDTRWFTNDGPLVREFESRIAEFVGVKHCIAMCNATIALEIAIRALDLKGEVIVPAYTFIATAHALMWQEIKPVFADIDPASHNIDPHSIRERITPNTTAIIGVHLWGRPCDTEALGAIASEYNLKLIYDAAHAFACSRGGRKIGSFGDCEVFSFHATKFLNSFEGGAVVTNNDELAAKMRLMRNFGFAGYDRVIYIGTNGKLTEICAAMGLTSLESIRELIAANRRNYKAYAEGLRDVPGISLLEYNDREQNNFQYIVATVDEARARLNRDQLVGVLHAENVLARKYFWPGCHRMEPYKSIEPKMAELLPVTDHVAAQTIVLPNGETVNPLTVGEICGLIAQAIAHSSEIRERFGTHQ